MLPEHRTPTHPGEVLLEDFLKPMELSPGGTGRASRRARPADQRAGEGKRGVTPQTAWVFAGAFGTTPELWLNLQANHDLAKARPARPVKHVASAV